MESGLDTSLSAHQQLYLNSWHFLAFAMAALVTMRLLPRGVARRLALLALNLYFVYFFVSGWWSALFLAGCVLATWGVGELQARLEDRLPAVFPVLLAVAMWMGLFFIRDPQLLPVVNPFHYAPVRIVGISYIVFRCLQYMLDADVLERRNLLTLANFILFFPTLISGPIERFENFQAWHDDRARVEDPSLLPALHRIANGMIKKFVLADNLMAWSVYEWRPGDAWSVPLLWLGMLLQLALLYLDFSGYCDIMIGVARLMGMRLMENFDRPWLAQNIQDFWTRWHISLSSFIRDYVFTPLNVAIMRHVPRRGQFSCVTLAYFFTMLLIALWHGTTWGFLLFGVCHGLALVLSQVLKTYGYARLSAPVQQLLVRGRPARV
ncbi:MAG TPA: MBOAT family O-acyltransferase, partial [Sumerlaeia bacterium]|nr:MBOAT family O-acyltransferase [Sumerlaeia bacterium]